MEERLLRIDQLCERLEMGRSTAWRYIKQIPEFPQPIKVGGLTRFREADLNSFLATLRPQAIANAENV